ncbi:hypothetical protein predicted by Glimmer/Critica [Sorangium cellulosum So ce56]|uniref:Uncharacterized protein n=1 Tax=Sorangium cellulosum (strain So ce56) TaxID=448385 RepID=A9GXH3_SORC5|nr:hypothetical protein [Sorangium cellulosum]CAN97090.1 hypothetical protein predicted by Glimmer/Critica [Sorangium cellulosum So ce56]
MDQPEGRQPRDHARLADRFLWRRDSETPAYERRPDALFDLEKLPDWRADAEFAAKQRRARATAGAAKRVIATRRGGAIGAISTLSSAASSSASAAEWRERVHHDIARGAVDGMCLAVPMGYAAARR